MTQFDRFIVKVTRLTGVLIGRVFPTKAEANSYYGYSVKFGNAGRIELVGCIGSVETTVRSWNKG